MNIYLFTADEIWWDDYSEYFVVANDVAHARELLDVELRGEEPDYSAALNPEEYRRTYKEFVEANIARFKHATPFGVAFVDEKPGILHSVFTPG